MVAPIASQVVSPVPARDWNRVYAQDRAPMPTQSAAWADTIARASWQADRSRLYRFRDGLEALLPLFSSRIAPRGLRITRSPPGAWGFGGPLSSAPLSPAHLGAILDDCTRLPGAGVEIRPNPLLEATWAQATEGTGWQRLDRTAHVLDLEGGFDKVWNDRFRGKTRNRIRKAVKAGVAIETGTGEALVDEFDGLFRRSIARWARRQGEFLWLAALRGHLRDPRAKFSGMARYSQGVLRLSIARIDGVAVAGIITLVDRNAHYTRGAMDERLVGNSQASYLLQKTAIEDACRRACRYYHMGETGSSASLASFKAGFGAVAVPYAAYRHERLPLMAMDYRLRQAVKKAIGFRDV